MLFEFLLRNNTTQAAMADELGVDRSQLNRWVKNPNANIGRKNIDAILEYCRRFDSAVTYEDLWGEGISGLLSCEVAKEMADLIESFAPAVAEWARDMEDGELSESEAHKLLPYVRRLRKEVIELECSIIGQFGDVAVPA
jgi:transcriptional regulator with XRE-family HTH domain